VRHTHLLYEAIDDLACLDHEHDLARLFQVLAELLDRVLRASVRSWLMKKKCGMHLITSSRGIKHLGIRALFSYRSDEFLVLSTPIDKVIHFGGCAVENSDSESPAPKRKV
jgi:hypothetical protein